MKTMEAMDVLKIILGIAELMKYGGVMRNEHYIHHIFSHLVQEYCGEIDLAENTATNLHPEWSTRGHYKEGKPKDYQPVGPEDGSPGRVDFAVGRYEKPDIGVEFAFMPKGWDGEKVIPDFIKLLDDKNPFNTSISFTLVFRENRLVQKGGLAAFEKAMNGTFGKAFERLRSNNRLFNNSRQLYLVVTEVDKDSRRRHWYYDNAGGRFVCGLPHHKSYVEQYQRVKRWYNRLVVIYEGIEHKVNSEYYQDEMYAFFQNCYHLKDWLKNDPKIWWVLGNALEGFVSGDKSPQCMRICGDLCNGSKHMVITRKPKIDKNTSVKSRDYGLQLGGEVAIVSVKYNIECQGKTYDALSLAQCCMKEWDKFMDEYDIPIPQNGGS